MLVAAVMEQAVLRTNYPACLREDFPDHLDAAIRVTEDIKQTLPGRDLQALARRSPALGTFDWATYLHCSTARLVHAAAALARRQRSGGRLLDAGAYFGNFALMFKRQGFDVDAMDAYSVYGSAMGATIELLTQEGVKTVDYDDAAFALSGVPDASYDVVFCGAVVEHIPHTPRLFLHALNRVLKPGGVLILDTPNLAYIYNRQKLARGDSPMPDIAQQFFTDIPFEGHHREYTASEMVWMLESIGHRRIGIELFNYSIYAMAEVQGRDVFNYWAMVADPTLREYIMTTSEKPNSNGGAVVHRDWREAFEETEPSWQRRLSEIDIPLDRNDEAEIARLQAEVAKRDALLVEVQGEVGKRDAVLGELQAERNHAVSTRDEMLSALQAERNEAVRIRDEIIAGQAATMSALRAKVPWWRRGRG